MSTLQNRWIPQHPEIKEWLVEARKQKAERELVEKMEARSASELRKEMTKRKQRDVNVGDLEAALIEYGGDEGRCAELFDVHPVVIRRKVKGSERLQRAKAEGREVAQARIEDHLYSAALGGDKGTKMRAMELIAKSQMDWATTKKVEHGGSLRYDVETMPRDVEEPDLPDLKVVNLDSALAGDDDD